MEKNQSFFDPYNFNLQNGTHKIIANKLPKVPDAYFILPTKKPVDTIEDSETMKLWNACLYIENILFLSIY